jgi:hypothetical protein
MGYPLSVAIEDPELGHVIGCGRGIKGGGKYREVVDGVPIRLRVIALAGARPNQVVQGQSVIRGRDQLSLGSGQEEIAHSLSERFYTEECEQEGSECVLIAFGQDEPTVRRGDLVSYTSWQGITRATKSVSKRGRIDLGPRFGRRNRTLRKAGNRKSEGCATLNEEEGTVARHYRNCKGHSQFGLDERHHQVQVIFHLGYE